MTVGTEPTIEAKAPSGSAARAEPTTQPDRPGWLARANAAALRFVDRRAPAVALAGSVDMLRRARVTVVTAIVAIGILVGNGAALFALGRESGVAWTNLVTAVAVIGILAAARSFRSQTVFAATLVAAGFLQLPVLWIGSGGSNVGALFSFAAVPLTAMLLTSWRVGVVYAALAMLAVIGSWVLGLPAPHVAFGGVGIPASGGTVRDAMLMMLGVGAFATLYDWAREASLRDVQAERARAEDSERRAREASRMLRTVADTARRLQSSRGEKLGAEIHHAVTTAAEVAGADRASVNLFDVRTRSTIAQHASLRVSDTPDVQRDRGLLDTYAWTTDHLGRNVDVIVPDVDDLPPEAAGERRQLGERGIRAWMVLPLRVGRSRAGYFALEWGTPRTWSDEEIGHLRLLAYTIGLGITQRHDEQARRESEEKFSRAFSSHPDGLLLATLDDLRIAECNAAFEQLSGVRREELVGRPLRELSARMAALGDGMSVEHIEEVGRGLLRDEHPEVEFRVAGGKGTRTLLATSAPLEIAGRPTLLVTVRDATERRELESQLLQAQKMEAVGRLAGGVAHDFNNMLTVIHGYAEALRESVGDAHAEELDAIQSSVERSAELTRRLLTFSRRQVLNPSRVDLSELVGRVESMLRRVIGEDITLATRGGDAGTVEVDAGQLEQALLNLAVNARDAMPGGGTLEVRADRMQIVEADAPRLGLPPGPYARLRVRDDGTGMEEEILDRVLDPFFTTKEEGKGSGLGLSMVDGFVRQSGGALAIASHPGRGTTVDLYLPQARGTGTTVTRSAVARHEVAGPSCTILLAEDEQALRRLVRRALEQAGHRVIEAADGREALDRATGHEGPIDVLLTDAVMPRMGGFELARNLRDARPGVRVLLMSGYPESSRADEGLPEGARLLGKPFSPTQLRGEVARLLADTSESVEGDEEKATS